MHAPAGIRTELFLRDGTWEDISTRVRRDGGNGINITRGRGNERNRTIAKLNLTLEDPDGDFNDLNPLSPYYGLIGPNTQLRVSLGNKAALDDNFNRSVSNAWTGGSFPWTITTSAGAADSDFDIDGTYGTHTHPAANVRHYSTTDLGQPNQRVRTRFKWSAATITGAPATIWMVARFTDISNYYVAIVECKTDGGLRLSIQKRVLGSLSSIEVQSVDFDNSSNFSTDEFYAEFYVEGSKLYAKAWDVNDPEPAAWFISTTDTALSTGDSAGVASRRETGNTNANLQAMFNEWHAVPGTIRAHMEVPNFGAAQWTPGGSDVTMPLQAAGAKRRLGASGAAALNSAMYRYITRWEDPTEVVGYWPCEGRGFTSQVGSAIGGPPLVVVGNGLSFGASSPWPGSESGIRMATGTQLRANVLTTTNTGAIRGQVLIQFPDTSLGDDIAIMEISQVKNPTVRKWRLEYQGSTGGSLRIRGFSQGGTAVETGTYVAFNVIGKTMMLHWNLEQDGADVDWQIAMQEVLSDGTVEGTQFSGTFLISSVGQLTGCVMGPTGALDGCVISHVAVANSFTALNGSEDAMVGHQGETDIDRFIRLCGEEGIPYEVIGGWTGDSGVRMGPMQFATLLKNLEACEDAGQGILYEPRHFFGLVYRPYVDLINQSDVVFDYDNRELTGEPFPEPDETLWANDVVAERTSGSVYRSVEETGPMSIQPPPDGIGRYDRPLKPNLAYDSQLPDLARWTRHIGTWRNARYPTITFDTHRRVFTQSISDDVDELDIGDGVAIINIPEWLEPPRIRQLTQGYSERIENFLHTVKINGQPSRPFDVAKRGTAQRDSAASRLNSAALSGATSLSVATDTGPLWTTGAVDFDIEVAGSVKHVTNVAGSSSPQTFTVDGAAVVADKDLPINSEVHIYPRAIRGYAKDSINTAIQADAANSVVTGVDTPPAVWVEGEGTGNFTDTSFVEDADPIGVVFIPPTTGSFSVYLAGELTNDNAGGFTLMSFMVRVGAVIGDGAELIQPSDSRSLLMLGTDACRFAKEFLFDTISSQLPPGKPINITMAHRRATAGNSAITRRMMLVRPVKTQGGAPGSTVTTEPRARTDVQDTSDTTVSTTYTTADMTPCGTSFVANEVGKARVHVSARIDNSGATSCFVSFAIREGGTVGSGTVHQAAADTRAIEGFQVNQTMAGASFLVTGLNNGNTYNVQLEHRVTGGTGTLENRYVNVEPVA